MFNCFTDTVERQRSFNLVYCRNNKSFLCLDNYQNNKTKFIIIEVFLRLLISQNTVMELLSVNAFKKKQQLSRI